MMPPASPTTAANTMTPNTSNRARTIGAPPATFRDWRYLAAAGAAGLVAFLGGHLLDRVARGILIFDAMGLALFCVTGASKASDFAQSGPRRAAGRAACRPRCR